MYTQIILCKMLHLGQKMARSPFALYIQKGVGLGSVWNERITLNNVLIVCLLFFVLFFLKEQSLGVWKYTASGLYHETEILYS